MPGFRKWFIYYNIVGFGCVPFRRGLAVEEVRYALVAITLLHSLVSLQLYLHVVARCSFLWLTGVRFPRIRFLKELDFCPSTLPPLYRAPNNNIQSPNSLRNALYTA